ncbi:MAG: flagellar hook-length control protein FliK [Melioribacteraceae bacterium]
MMNLNPLFFDKSFLVGNKNFLSSSDNSNKTYLFSDIIKICEEELDASQQNINQQEKEILLDVNDLKNLTITKSNKETVEGIQQAIELLENIALISNSNSVNINSAHITSKIFILDKENLELFFNKINESLKQKDFSDNGNFQDSKIVYLNEKDKNNQINSTGSSEYDFISFNPEAIITSIDNNDIFNVTLKTNGEKLTLTISSTEPAIENKNNLSKKLKGTKSQNDLIASNKNINYEAALNNLYDIEKTKENKFEKENSTFENQSEVYPQEKYYKLEFIHTSFENNNFIYSPDKDFKTNIPAENNLFAEESSKAETDIVDSKGEVDNSKIAGVINPVKKNENELNSVNIDKTIEKNNSAKHNKTEESNNYVNIEKSEADNSLSQIILNKNFVNDNSVEKSYNKEFEKTSEYSPRIKNDSLNENNILPSSSSQIDFSLLSGGKFTKAKIIKDSSQKEITNFNPVVINKKSEASDKKEINEVKSDYTQNELENKIKELNIESIKVETKKVNLKAAFETPVNFNEKHNSKEVKSYQKIIPDNQEQIKEPLPDKLIESFAKSSLKSFLNENKKNQTNDAAEKVKPVNLNNADESKKVDANTNQVNLVHKTNSNEPFNYQSFKQNEVKITPSVSSNDANFSKDSKDEKSVKKNLSKSDSSVNDLEKNVNKIEQVISKEPQKNLQINTHENSNQKIELPDNQINTLKSKIQNEFGNLKESLKVINANQITDEISKYINGGNKQSITFQLSPENLGKLTLSIDYIENQLRANIEVENEQVKQLIQNNIEQLKNSLQSSGIQLNDVNVSLSNYEQKSLRNSNNRKKSYSKSYGKEINVENSKAPSTKKLMGYNTYDYLI